MKIPLKIILYSILFFLLIAAFISKFISLKPAFTNENPALIINEYLAQNNSTILDNSGEYPDWIEILNTGLSDVNLANYALSDDENKPLKWRLPSYTLKPGEYLIIFASGKNKNFPEQREFHSNFKLGSEDKKITLSLNNRVIDSVDIKRTGPDISMGRQNPAENNWTIMAEPSPGFPNTREGYLSFMESRLVKDSPVLVNEFMYSNRSTIRDEDWEYPDWIELYNSSKNALNLKGYGLSDDPGSPSKWTFPETTLEPGKYLVVFASGKNKIDTLKSFHHTNFKLDEDETVLLYSPDGKILDSIKLTALSTDNSLGRSPENLKKWTEFSRPTPGFENSSKGYTSFLQGAEASTDIVISEALALNTSSSKDEDGEYSDWVEIYNPTSSSLNLEEYFLSDDPEKPHKWKFPSGVINPGQHLLVYASGKNRSQLGRPLHTSFKLDSINDAVYIANSSGKILSKLVTSDLPPGVACGRPEDKPGFAVFESPTPGARNPNGYSGVCKMPVFSHEGGLFKEAISLSIMPPTPDTSIHYTLDGSVPTGSSPIYKEPLNISKTTVVRARSFSKENLQSPVVTSTYFISPRTTLPLISVSTDPRNFWDENTGIYSMGKNASQTFPYQGANFWQDRERPIHIEFYETDGTQGFSLDAGIKIFGAYSRAMAQKSFSILAREEYGEGTIDYKIFKDKPIEKFNSIVLRTSGQDATLSKIRDAMMTRLSASMGLDVQGYRPAVLYVNGEYFGIYNIREKIDEYFLASNHNLENPKAIDILEANGRVKVGDNSNYKALLDYVSNHDLRIKSNYEYVKTQMDVYNYMDYQISEMYFGNTDAGNISYWREDSPVGKWRWIVFDTDWGFWNVKHNTVAFNLNPEGTGVGKYFSTVLVRKLMENDEFREEFLKRFAQRMNTILQPENVLSIIDGMSKTIEPEMPYQVQKWGSSMKTWRSQIEVLRDFARQRPSYLYGYIRDYFKLSDDGMNELGFIKP